MNKLKQLGKRLGIEAAIVLVLVGAAVGVMMLTGSMAESAAQRKTEAESGLSQDNSQLASVRTQLERSGEAEKRFVDIQLNRTNIDFSSRTETLREWMRAAKARYRFSNSFRLNLPPEVPSNKPELSGLDYAINVREGVTLDLDAVSDLHILSFLDDMNHAAPGLVRITQVKMERNSDMSPQALAQMMGGIAPSLVGARIQFTWVGVNPKVQGTDAGPASAADPSAAAAVPEGMPTP